jgi:hypothetical protein
MSELEDALSAKAALESKLSEEASKASQRFMAEEEERSTLKLKLQEAEAGAEEWCRRHKEVQALSDQAYEIMRNEIVAKEEELVAMHTANARLTRSASQQMQQMQQAGGQGGGDDHNANAQGSGDGGAAGQQMQQQQMPPMMMDSSLDRKKAQQAERAAARAAAGKRIHFFY